MVDQVEQDEEGGGAGLKKGNPSPRKWGVERISVEWESGEPLCPPPSPPNLHYLYP